MVLQAGSFSKITSIASGQRVLRRGVVPGAGIKTPGGSCGNCASSVSVPGNSSPVVSSGILCDMLPAILLLSLTPHLYCGVNSCPKSSTILANRVLAALVQSGVSAFLPPSGTLSPQESPARRAGLQRHPLSRPKPHHV